MLAYELRRLSIALLLVIMLTSALAPVAGASAPLSARLPASNPSTSSGQARQPSTFNPPPPPPNPQPVRLLSSTESGVVFEVTVPWEDLNVEPVTAGGKAYVRVSLPGWSSTSQVGAPALPQVAEAIGAPFGADVAVRVTPGKAHTMALPAPVLPVATQVVDWVPPAEGAAPALPEPRTVVEEDATIYSGGAAYPNALARVTGDGVMRQQRVAGISAYPVQYNPAARELTVYESLRIEVAFIDQGSGVRDQEIGVRDQESGVRDQAAESGAYEEILQGALLNYEAARGWRVAFAPASPMPGKGTNAHAAEATATTPWPPPDPGWRIKVREDGFYKLTYKELLDAGVLETNPNPRAFRLYHLGSEVAIYVEGEGDNNFGENDYILFYGQALATKYTVDNVYWLTVGEGDGLRMGTQDGTPGAGSAASAYPETLHLEANKTYRPLTPGADSLDRWLWYYVNPPSTPSWSTPFTLTAPYMGDPATTATVRVSMLGGLDYEADPDHHTQIYLNGTPPLSGTLLEDAKWDGKTWRVAEVTFLQSELAAGKNTLWVYCPNDLEPGVDAVYVDWAELEFANTFTAEDDELAFGQETAGARKYRVDGFSTDLVAVFNVTDPAAVTIVEGISVTPAGDTHSVEFQSTAAATKYWAMANIDTTYRTVQAIEADTPSDLAATTNGADWVAITHADFSVQAAALAEHRAAQGWRTALVDVQDVYDEFGYGIVSAAAIHDFLAYAYSHWQTPAPSYVVLVGDGHYDPNDYLGYSRDSYIPPYLALVDPWFGETAADNRYVTLSGSDTLPDMMLGRLSVNSAAGASVLVNKIKDYENSPVSGDWQQQVLMVADGPEVDYRQMSDNLLINHLPAPYTASKVYYGNTHTTVASARAAILAGISAGKLIVNYMGHGAPDLWAEESLFRTTYVPSLTNGGKLPVMLPMTCFEGFYHYPYPNVESLAEVVTGADGKGAVASWSPTGLGLADGHEYLDQGFFDAVFQDALGVLGAGTAAGKLSLFATGENLDLLDTYLLFGDPAMRLPTACAAPAAAVSDVTISASSATQVQLAWTAVTGASLYQVWWNAADPYFTPDASCTEANGCAWRSAPSFTHAGGLGDTTVNNSYLVLPASACGAVQATPSNRTGEFDFALVPGN